MLGNYKVGKIIQWHLKVESASSFSSFHSLKSMVFLIKKLRFIYRSTVMIRLFHKCDIYSPHM